MWSDWESTHWFVNVLEIYDNYESQLKTISHSIYLIYSRQNIHQIYRWRSNLSIKTTKMLSIWQPAAASWSFSDSRITYTEKLRSQETVDVIGIIPNAVRDQIQNVQKNIKRAISAHITNQSCTICWHSNLTSKNLIFLFTRLTYAVLSRITWTLS